MLHCEITFSSCDLTVISVLLWINGSNWILIKLVSKLSAKQDNNAWNYWWKHWSCFRCPWQSSRLRWHNSTQNPWWMFCSRKLSDSVYKYFLITILSITYLQSLANQTFFKENALTGLFGNQHFTPKKHFKTQRNSARLTHHKLK